MMPTNKNTPNNNPYLAALMFFLIISTVMIIFTLITYFVDDGVIGDTEGGIAVFGSGTGNGVGGKAGDHKGDGTSSEQGTATKKAPKAQQKSGQGSKSQQEEESEASASSAQSEENDFGPVKIPKNTPIAELQWDDTQAEQDIETEKDSSSSHFASGGKSVFKVKKHENVLFIVDISGSMHTGTAENLSRLEVLKIQLKRAISSQANLKSRGKYGIIAFNDQKFYCPGEGKEQLRFYSRQDCKTAEQWINQMDNLPGGGTDLYPALLLAVRLMQEKKIKVDTIYLLSDGAVASNSQVYIDLLKKAPKKIKVHTICIGDSSQLLKDIAHAFNGKYEEYR